MTMPYLYWKELVKNMDINSEGIIHRIWSKVDQMERSMDNPLVETLKEDHDDSPCYDDDDHHHHKYSVHVHHHYLMPFCRKCCVRLSWCSFPSEWERNRNPLSICQHIFSVFVIFLLSLSLSFSLRSLSLSDQSAINRWIEYERVQSYAKDLFERERREELNNDLSTNSVAHVQLTIINRNMRMCIEISDYRHTCSRIEQHARKDQRTGVTILSLFCIDQSSGGLDHFIVKVEKQQQISTE